MHQGTLVIPCAVNAVPFAIFHLHIVPTVSTGSGTRDGVALDVNGGNAEFVTQQLERVGIPLADELLAPAAAAEKRGHAVRFAVIAGIGGVVVIRHLIADIIVNRLRRVIAGAGSPGRADGTDSGADAALNGAELTVSVGIPFTGGNVNLHDIASLHPNTGTVAVNPIDLRVVHGEGGISGKHQIRDFVHLILRISHRAYIHLYRAIALVCHIFRVQGIVDRQLVVNQLAAETAVVTRVGFEPVVLGAHNLGDDNLSCSDGHLFAEYFFGFGGIRRGHFSGLLCCFGSVHSEKYGHSGDCRNQQRR